MSGSDAQERWRTSRAPLGDRSNYKKVWEAQSEDGDVAALAVSGHTDEATLELTARGTIDMLKSTIGIDPSDVILEIGCGIGRVGLPLSKECLHWVGSDISSGMLKHAAARLASRPNTTLVELASVGLLELPADSFDVVYCTIVFMHLLEWDRFRYVEEAFRVLRPGGRCYVDNFTVDTETGWKIFMDSYAYLIDRRPAHISMSSSREELRTYLVRAGFEDVKVHDLANGLIAATGRKPESAP